MPRKLTDKDIDRIFDLTGDALSGILADHHHVSQVPGCNCGQSCAEWASTLGIETFHRLRHKLKLYPEVAETKPERQLPRRISKRMRLYPPQQSL